MVGLGRRGLLSGGICKPSKGFCTRKPYRTAERRMLERASLIFRIEGCSMPSLTNPEKYRCKVSGVSSRRQAPWNLVSRYFAMIPWYEFDVVVASRGSSVG